MVPSFFFFLLVSLAFTLSIRVRVLYRSTLHFVTDLSLRENKSVCLHAYVLISLYMLYTMPVLLTLKTDVKRVF